jgi:hypothetical protein
MIRKCLAALIAGTTLIGFNAVALDPDDPEKAEKPRKKEKRVRPVIIDKANTDVGQPQVDVQTQVFQLDGADLRGQTGAHIVITADENGKMVVNGREMNIDNRRGNAGNVRNADNVAPRPYMGVSANPVSKTLARQLKLEPSVGLAVAHVDAASGSAGVLQEHDILLKMDDQLLINSHQLSVLVRRKKAGDTIQLEIMRDGVKKRVAVTLGERNLPELGVWNANQANLDLPPPDIAPFVVNGDGEVDVNAIQQRVQNMIRQNRMRHAQRNVRNGQPADPQTLWHKRPDGQQQNPNDLIEDLERKLQGQDNQKPHRRHHTNAHTQTQTITIGGNGAAAVSTSSVSMADGRMSVTLTTSTNEGKHLLAKTPAGDVLYDGPVDTDAQRAALPADVRKMLKELEKTHATTINIEVDALP